MKSVLFGLCLSLVMVGVEVSASNHITPQYTEQYSAQEYIYELRSGNPKKKNYRFCHRKCGGNDMSCIKNCMKLISK